MCLGRCAALFHQKFFHTTPELMLRFGACLLSARPGKALEDRSAGDAKFLRQAALLAPSRFVSLGAPRPVTGPIGHKRRGQMPATYHIDTTKPCLKINLAGELTVEELAEFPRRMQADPAYSDDLWGVI